jgi:hypothetical protein
MVQGLQATLAFHFTDKYGSGVNGDGYLLNSQNDTILQFSPHHFGIGKFSFIPKKDNQYRAVVRFDNGKVVSKQLNAAYDQGYVVKLSEPDTAHIKVLVTTNLTSGNFTYLFLHTRHHFKAMLQQQFLNGVAEFIVDKKIMDDGVNHFTVFNNDRQPVCERLYFKRPSKNSTLIL